MTNQQAFDKVWDWFVVQKNPPGLSREGCRYRANLTPQGPRCALGLFIPDEEYTVRIENGGISYLQVTHPDLVARWLPGLGFEFLAELQGAHDNAAGATTSLTSFNKEVEAKLRRVARSFSLSIPETKVEHKPEAGIENLSIVRQGAVRDERIGAGGRAEDGQGGKASPARLQMQEV